jgi:hypothetical protein
MNPPIYFAKTITNRAQLQHSRVGNFRYDLCFAKELALLFVQLVHFYVDHEALKYIVNKPIFSERINKWLILFQECDFHMFVKPSKAHVGPNHLS